MHAEKYIANFCVHLNNSMAEGVYHEQTGAMPSPYQKFFIYHTKHTFIIAGYCKVKKHYG